MIPALDLHPVKVPCYEVFFFSFFFKVYAIYMQACAVRNALGVIGENHNILSKKSTKRGDFDLLSRCLDD